MPLLIAKIASALLVYAKREKWAININRLRLFYDRSFVLYRTWETLLWNFREHDVYMWPLSIIYIILLNASTYSWMVAQWGEWSFKSFRAAELCSWNVAHLCMFASLSWIGMLNTWFLPSRELFHKLSPFLDCVFRFRASKFQFCNMYVCIGVYVRCVKYTVVLLLIIWFDQLLCLYFQNKDTIKIDVIISCI